MISHSNYSTSSVWVSPSSLHRRVARLYQLRANWPHGPSDTTTNIVNGWREKAERGLFSKEQVAPTPSIEALLKEGRMGRKNGKGFYDVSETTFHLL